MKLTAKRFFDLGIESDLICLRSMIDEMQKDVNKLNKLKKKILRSADQEVQSWLDSSSVEKKIYEEFHAMAEGKTRVECIAMVQRGELHRLKTKYLGELENVHQQSGASEATVPGTISESFEDISGGRE